jgi:hypothetical protein
MKDLNSILKGFKTHRFCSYLEKGYTLNESECFSLHFKERSFDFVAENAKDCDDIVGKIQLLRDSK